MSPTGRESGKTFSQPRFLGRETLQGTLARAARTSVPCDYLLNVLDAHAELMPRARRKLTFRLGSEAIEGFVRAEEDLSFRKGWRSKGVFLEIV